MFVLLVVSTNKQREISGEGPVYSFQTVAYAVRSSSLISIDKVVELNVRQATTIHLSTWLFDRRTIDCASTLIDEH